MLALFQMDVRRFLALFNRWRQGQGLVEFALVFPVLLIMLSGLMEFGFALNEYLDVLDGAREAARFASDANPFSGTNDNPSFYKNASDLAEQTMAPLLLCDDLNGNKVCDLGEPGKGDIVISSFSVGGGSVVARFPKAGCPPYFCIPNQSWRRFGTETTKFSNAEINARLNSLAPNTGLVLVEIFFDYEQKFKLPWITVFVPDPVKLHTYTMMPLVAAEPTPTNGP